VSREVKQLSMHVTDLCNEKCGFCVVGSPLAKTDGVDYADLLRYLVANAGQGFESVNLHGGEPTIHPRLFDLLDTIRLLGYPEVQLQTNARRLKDPEFVRRLVDGGVRVCVVSMHGADATVQDLLTQTPGGFAETVRGVRNAIAAGITVQTNTVLTRMNMRQLGAICALCVDLGVHRINISNLHPVGSGFYALDVQAPTFAETRAHLIPVLDDLATEPVTVTVEGFPLCEVTPYERLAIEDGHRFIRMLYHGNVHDNYDEFMDAECREFGPPCEGCPLRGDCSGVYHEYVERRGWTEFGLPQARAAAGS